MSRSLLRSPRLASSEAGAGGAFGVNRSHDIVEGEIAPSRASAAFATWRRLSDSGLGDARRSDTRRSTITSTPDMAANDP